MIFDGTNNLINESSPYLLQHARNPVNWYPWGEEALNRAREENKLLVISIGYSACHWCHVMEQECFEDQEVAEMMNTHYISVKIDREERPDIDQIYMNACYLINGQGGWPLNVIALPDERPLFAGTYFAKRDWLYVLRSFSDMHRQGDQDLIKQAQEVMRRLKIFRKSSGDEHTLPDDPETLDMFFNRFAGQLDFVDGGISGAPKFPMPGHLQFLLRYASLRKNLQAEDYVWKTLDKMARGGIYDHIGGGFYRYSVDAKWLVPHFEKMLYDNAQLVNLYALAYHKQKTPLYREVVAQTIEWIDREMTSPEGLWYASLDADSEGKEGTFYIWTEKEIRALLEEQATALIDYYGITEEGNWEEGKNILRIPGENEPGKSIMAMSQKLLDARSGRTRPALDDKILTSWNGLMIRGYVQAWRALGNQEYLHAALQAGDFYREAIRKTNGKVYRVWKNNRFSVTGFLDDYAFLVTAFLELYQATFDTGWIESVHLLIRYMNDHFREPEMQLFHYTSDEDPVLIERPVEIADHVIPSSNSETALGLLKYGLITGEKEFSEQAMKMLAVIIPQAEQQLLNYANWGLVLLDYLVKPVEVAIVGPEYQQILKEMLQSYLPDVLFAGGENDQSLESLKGKFQPGRTAIYLCRDQTCLSPVYSIRKALDILSQWR